MDLTTFGLDEIDAVVTLKFQMQAKALLGLLEKTAVVVPNRDVIPVLANFRIQASPNAMRVGTTNLEISMLCATKDVEVSTPGVGYFPIRRFLDIIKECPDTLVSVTVHDQVAVISTGRTTWTLNLSSGIGYPPLPEVSELRLVSVERASFASALHGVRYAAATNPAKETMMMVCIADEKVTACDGVRLQRLLLRDFPLNMQIPIHAVDDILKLLDKSTLEHIMAGEATNHLVFQVGADLLVINKLDMEFPDVDALMLGPAMRNKERMFVDCQSLIDAIKQVKVNADIEFPAVTLEAVHGSLVVKTIDRYGKAQSVLNLERPMLEKRVFVFNHRMLLAMLRAYPAKVCEFCIDGDTKTKKLPVLLIDQESRSYAVLAQMIGGLVD